MANPKPQVASISHPDDLVLITPEAIALSTGCTNTPKLIVGKLIPTLRQYNRLLARNN